jgi:hypothetical protein
MRGTYRYVIHAYEDARQKRPMKHEHGGTTVLAHGAEALERAELLAKGSPTVGSTSTSSTEGRRSRQGFCTTLGHEPGTELTLGQRSGARALPRVTP